MSSARCKTAAGARNPLTVKELLEDHWLPAQRLRGLRPATLNQYENVVDHWLLPHVGATKVNALRPAAVTAMVERLRTDKSSRGRTGLSPRSAQITVGVLKAACKWAVENEITRNPVVGIQRPRVSQTAMRAWSADQARSFLTKTRDDRLAVGWALLSPGGYGGASCVVSDGRTSISARVSCRSTKRGSSWTESR